MLIRDTCYPSLHNRPCGHVGESAGGHGLVIEDPDVEEWEVDELVGGEVVNPGLGNRGGICGGSSESQRSH